MHMAELSLQTVRGRTLLAKRVASQISKSWLISEYLNNLRHMHLPPHPSSHTTYGSYRSSHSVYVLIIQCFTFKAKNISFVSVTTWLMIIGLPPLIDTYGRSGVCKM